jgi:hypothetical protein
LSIARIAKAAQSSSGAKQTAIAAPDATDEAGNAGENAPITSERAIRNTNQRIQL